GGKERASLRAAGGLPRQYPRAHRPRARRSARRGAAAAVSLRQRFHRDRSAAHAGAQAVARGVAAAARRPLGARISRVRAVGRAARLAWPHGARPSVRRDGTRRGRAAACGAGGILLMEVPAALAVVPVHSASKTRVNALMLGTHIPETVVMGPRFRGDDSM